MVFPPLSFDYLVTLDGLTEGVTNVTCVYP